MLIAVVKRHRFVNAVADDGAQRIGATLQNFFQLFKLRLREIFEENFTVSDKIEFIIRTVAGQRPVSFFDLFENAASRTEIAVTFLALLELIRMKQIRVFQEGLFAEIEIRAVN